MSRLLALAVVTALFGCGPCAAQQGGFGAPPTPGSGTTSPLGAIVTTSPVGGLRNRLGPIGPLRGGIISATRRSGRGR